MASHADWEVIVVHGVGAPPPGSILDASLQGLSSGATHAFQREDVVVDGVALPRALCKGVGAPFAVTEVNWSDLLRPSGGAAGTMRHQAMLALAMLDGAASLDGGSWVIRLYRWLFEWVFLWCVWPAIACLLVATLGFSYTGYALLGVLLVALIASGWTLSKYLPGATVAAVAWAVAAALFAIGTPWWPGPWIEASAKTYAYAQVLAVVALFAAAVTEVIWLLWASVPRNPKGRKISTLFGRLALLYVPAVMASSLGSILWVAALWAVPHGQDFEAWGTRFAGGLGYDLRLVEYVVGGTVLILGVAALALAVLVWLLSTIETRAWPRRSGALAGDFIFAILVVAPVALGAASLVFLDSFMGGLFPASFGKSSATLETYRLFVDSLLESFSPGSSGEGSLILATYQRSALRVLPYLVAALGPLGVVMDVLGDVGFYLARRPNLDIGVEARRRLVHALKVARCSGKQILVVAHSQGSVIAFDTVAGGQAIDRLVTIGSPISTLYARLIGRTFKSVTPTAWVNAFRLGDYIGGPNASAGATDVPLGPGGHTNYFDDPEIWKV